jgi:hypothetical protein
MSQENVKIVQGFWDAWARKDFEGLIDVFNSKAEALAAVGLSD